MRGISSYDVRTGNADNDKYFGFCGQDWWFVEPESEDLARAKKRGELVYERRKYSPDNTAKEKGPGPNIRAAAAEFAVEHLLGIRTQGDAFVKDAADVGEFEVKTYNPPFNWELISNVRNHKPHRIYILVWTQLWPKYLAVIGWAYGSVVMENRRKPSWATHEIYFCSWHRLQTMDTLPMGK